MSIFNFLRITSKKTHEFYITEEEFNKAYKGDNFQYFSHCPIWFSTGLTKYLNLETNYNNLKAHHDLLKVKYDLLGEDLDCSHDFLNDLGIPKYLGDNEYSLQGRINLLSDKLQEK